MNPIAFRQQPVEKTALITGASSGFGLLTAVTLARRGWHVLATMRDLSRSAALEEAACEAGVWQRIELLRLDVTQGEQIVALATEIKQRKTPLNAIVNNAGFAVGGFADDVSDAELREQFDTNFFGAVAVTRAFLPQLRRQGAGHIVMVSSISGRTGFPAVGSYVASKHALEGWTETLRLEMQPLGIPVAMVEPGSFETSIWTRGARMAAGASSPDSPNATRTARLGKRMKDAGKRSDPQQVANTIARILESKQPRLRYVVGTDARIVVWMRRLLPWKIFERVMIRVSGIAK